MSDRTTKGGKPQTGSDAEYLQDTMPRPILWYRDVEAHIASEPYRCSSTFIGGKTLASRK